MFPPEFILHGTLKHKISCYHTQFDVYMYIYYIFVYIYGQTLITARLPGAGKGRGRAGQTDS